MGMSIGHDDEEHEEEHSMFMGGEFRETKEDDHSMFDGSND